MIFHNLSFCMIDCFKRKEEERCEKFLFLLVLVKTEKIWNWRQLKAKKFFDKINKKLSFL